MDDRVGAKTHMKRQEGPVPVQTPSDCRRPMTAFGEGTAAKEAFCDGRKICEGIRSLRFKRAGS